MLGELILAFKMKDIYIIMKQSRVWQIFKFRTLIFLYLLFNMLLCIKNNIYRLVLLCFLCAGVRSCRFAASLLLSNDIFVKDANIQQTKVTFHSFFSLFIPAMKTDC